MDKKPLKLDFIGIGVPKAATTWTSQCLREHPAIYLPKIKEIYFFSSIKKYQQGLNYYQTYFRDAKKKQIKGEFSPNYLYCPAAAKRIKKYFPYVKLIICLRDPIERLYSQYWYDKIRGAILSKNFETAIQTKEIKIEHGFYYKHLQPFLKLFPKNQILILIYEKIKQNPIKFIQNIYQFLEVESNFIPPSINQKIWATSKEQYPLAKLNKIKLKIIKFYKQNTLLKKILSRTKKEKADKILLKFSLSFDKITSLKKKKLNAKSLSKPPLKRTTRLLLQKIYQPDIRNLEKLLEQKLNYWR